MNLKRILKTAIFAVIYIGYLVFLVYIGLGLLLLAGTYATLGTDYVGGGPMAWVTLVWIIITVVQFLLGHWPAFRLLRQQDNNGLSLFGWLIAMCVAAFVPGLGFFLWHRYRKNFLQINKCVGVAQPLPLEVISSSDNDEYAL
ncbi:MAG: hypothetical protein FWC73_08010 [Defluviitaleaceae bacterium]|nr:hypothetical protein [Defluviitaleaceae bacterium]